MNISHCMWYARLCGSKCVYLQFVSDMSVNKRFRMKIFIVMCMFICVVTGMLMCKVPHL